ncbi:hypothetical protein [Halobacillus sp. BBL2006]|uniref:DUF6933 domain-containing protein n=1 Tax=Halobacillus sp. BBL2006 TaxID=1543706 RepID=UPI0005425371|nr:hypothetical protein [Halobacillus sp. BBL2006]KHE69717.1 hypothetical protein LD39_12500 [Halobacillus sp. BBL2006]
MFVVGATKKLQNEISKPLADVEDYQNVPEIYQWHANIITINRRKCLVLMNNHTCLNLTLLGLRKQQFENLDDVIKGSLNQLLQLLDIEESVINKMLEAADQIVYTKTKSRQILGMMNEIKFEIESKTEGLSYEEIDAVKLNKGNNKDFIFLPLKHHSPYNTFIKYFQEEE